MADIAPKDRAMLQVLMTRGLVTQDQARRVRQALELGKSMDQAMQNTPLVDPLQFMKAQQAAAKAGPDGQINLDDDMEVVSAATKGVPGNMDLTPIPKAGRTYKDDKPDDDLPTGIDLDFREAIAAADRKTGDLYSNAPTHEEHVGHAVDLDMDLDLGEQTPAHKSSVPKLSPPPPPRLSPPPPPSPAAALASGEDDELDPDLELEFDDSHSSPPASDLPEDFTMGSVGPPLPSSLADSLEVPKSSDGYRPQAGKIPEFDLNDDEGIALIKEVNFLLQGTAMKGNAALRFVIIPDETRLEEYDSFGCHANEILLATEVLEKQSNRLKVMARMQPRSREPQMGMFYARFSGLDYTCLLETEIRSSGEALRVFILQGKK